jgi:tetratricopeptide (TPR) repeat protein
MDAQRTKTRLDAKSKKTAVDSPRLRLWPRLGLRTHLAVVFVLGAIILCAFANTLRNSGPDPRRFALDNKFIILEDPRLRANNNENRRLIFAQDYWYPKAVSGLYRPLTTLSYLLNYSILHNRENATGYHWINFLLHWGDAALVYFMALLLMQRLWPAAFVAAVFATHPIITESVTNIIGRADLFATAAVLGAFLCYAKSTTITGSRKLPWLIAVAVITTIGVFCKESAVVVLGLMGLYDVTFRLRKLDPNWFVNLSKNFWRFCITGYVAILPPLITLIVVRRNVFGKLRPPELPFVDNPLIGADFLTARLTAIKVIGRYLALLLFPKTLSCDYSYNQVPIVNWSFHTWEDWQSILALVGLIAVVFLAIRNYDRNKPLFFFILFFFGTLLPSSNLIPNPTFGQSLFDRESWCIGSIMAERFLYLPSIGFAGCVVIAVYAICQRFLPQREPSGDQQRVWLQFVPRSALAAIVVACGVRTWLRNPDWDNDVALWSQAVRACPNSFKTHKSLAYALYEVLSQMNPADKRYDPLLDRIIDEGERALRVTDKTQIVFLHLGAYYRMKGDRLAQARLDGGLITNTPASAVWYRKSVETLEGAVPLDRAFNEDNRQKELKRGREPDQIQDIGNHEIYWNLGLSYMRLAQYEPALRAYFYMRHLSPANPDACQSIATVYIDQGRAEDAAIALLQTLLLDGNRTDALRTLVQIYKQIDHEGCAVTYSPGQADPKLNSDCAIVRNHICTAYLGLAQVFLETKNAPLAQQIKQNALRNYPCPPEPFNRLRPDTPPQPNRS